MALDAQVLDVGTSTGTNLRLLRDLGFSNVRGLDNSEEAIHLCEMKGLGKVDRGDICALPFKSGSFDLVLATDVIEHVDDDTKAVHEIARVLKRGGTALITVPAFQALWGLQDEKAHHKRRYLQREVVHLAEQAGLTPIRHWYFNYILFVPIWLARHVIKFFNIRLSSENEVNSPLLNRLLTAVFHLDIRTARVLRIPFGVSVLVIARKDGAESHAATS